MTSPDSRQNRMGFARRLSLLVLLGATVLGALYLTLDRASNRQVQGVVARWEARLGTPEQLQERYPRRDANPAALRLEGLAAQLGIDLATRGMPGRSRPADPAAETFNNVRKSIFEYNAAQWKRIGEGSSAPPVDLATFLATHASEFDAVRRVLLDGESPRWEFDFQELYDGPIPNLLGHITLQRVLMAEALAQGHEGNHEKALETLEASALLNRGLRDDPIIITQMIAVYAHRIHAATLRRLDPVPLSWRDRLTEHDFRETMIRAIELELWMGARLDPTELVSSLPWWQRTLARVVSPYIRACACESSERTLRGLMARAAPTDPCQAPDEASRTIELGEPAWWNRIDRANASALSLLDCYHRVTRLEIDVELTCQWIALTDARRKSGGSWPRNWPEEVSSNACPKNRWLFEFGPDGSASIAFSRDLDWFGQHKPEIPNQRTSIPEDV